MVIFGAIFAFHFLFANILGVAKTAAIYALNQSKVFITMNADVSNFQNSASQDS